MQYLPSVFALNKSSTEPVYLQIAGMLLQLTKNGTLQSGVRLPSTRKLAQQLEVHRKTVVRAYDELLAQGWLESRSGDGTFVAKHVPESSPQRLLISAQKTLHASKVAGFQIVDVPHLTREEINYTYRLHLDDGLPDSRLAPLTELSRAYRSQLLTGNPYVKLGYSDTKGSPWLRDQLSDYLNESRGLRITKENILITRGSIMGIYLASTGLIKQGDHVVTGETSWRGADANFIQAGAILNRIPVDQSGIQTDELEKLCSKKTIRLVYVTSHHHYPTTVALSAERRLRLLKLSEKYGFIIFEDDYDYDFHYENKPLLPLASADESGMVLYCGSFTKSISPAFRVGYLVGPENVIHHLAQLRRVVDRQGDVILENAIAELLRDGIVQRHMRKSLRLYRQRRDFFCSLLKNELGKYIEFSIPDGGMAVWTKFDPGIDLVKLAAKALTKDLSFSNGLVHQHISGASLATRLGFASSTEKELTESVGILSEILRS